MLIAQPEEQLAGDEVDQAVFQRPGREAYPAVTAQARLAEDVTFAEAVEQLAIGPVDLHRATADIVQLVEGSVIVQNGGSCLEVANLSLARNIVQSFFRQLVKGREAAEVVADLDQFDLHGHLPARTLASV